MQKNYRIILMTLTAALFAVSCSTEQDATDVNSGRTSLRLRSEVAGETTRSTVTAGLQGTAIEADNEIGVFVERTDVTGTSYGYRNVSYFSNGDGTMSTDEEVYFPFSVDVSEVAIYAYAPRQTGYGALGSFPFTVDIDQSSADGYVASDLMVGLPKDGNPVTCQNQLSTTPTEKSQSVTLSFRHAMSKLSFTFEPSTILGESGLVGALITLPEVAVTTTLNLRTGGLSDPRDVTEVVIAELEAVEQLYANAIVPPQTLSAGTDLIQIELSDGTLFRYTLPDDMELTGGKQYRYNVYVGNDEIYVRTTVSDWNAGDERDGVAD